MDKKEANLLEGIIELKLKTILPRKLRLLVNIYAHSEELRAMIGEIFRCVGELLIAKRDLIAAVGSFVEQKVSLLVRGRSGANSHPGRVLEWSHWSCNGHSHPRRSCQEWHSLSADQLWTSLCKSQ